MSNKYWAERARQRMDGYHRDSDRVIGKVLEAYQAAIEEINTAIQKILNTYSKDAKLSMEEAKKYLTIVEKKEFIENLKKAINYVQDEDMKAEMLRQINAPAYRARLTKLQAIKEKLNVECKKLADIQVRNIEKGQMNTAKTAYYRTMFDMQQMTGYGFSFAEIPVKQVEEILKNNWSGKHFSERIWENTENLSSELEHVLTKGFMNGASVQRMAKDIADKMQAGEFAAARLIRTETTYVANSAEVEAYKEAGVEKFQFLATLDLRTSDLCREHDGKIYDLNEAEIGKNVPPLHPNCRSTTLEVFEDDDLEKLQRRARDPVTGKNKTVPANMTYKEWYSENVANNPKAQAEEKKIKNRASDKKQFDMYSKVLEEDLPVKDFAEFQNLKYNDSEEWEKLKSDYRYKNMLNKRKVVNEDKNNRSLPLESEPNSITDLIYDGKVKQRRIYDDNGKAVKDIDTTDHNKPKYHPMGAHKHEYNYNDRNPRGKPEYFTEDELRQNKDIIKEGENYNVNKSK
ncbi:minor capsid protein [Clostridium thermarum]|uniref:minor capsid protein n=1 Tax=Clostridium thermarum TaxID=1716543 RepID=UPI0013D3C3A0|nr:minor capsid protein [Clostridium thermarum]